MLTLRLCVPLMSFVLMVSGCMSTGGYPERPEAVTAKLSKLQKSYFLPGQDVLAVYEEKENSEKREYRDTVVHARLLAIDMQYGIFKEAIYQEGVSSNLTVDVLGVAVGAVGATVTGTEASRILSALSGGIAGTGTAINKNLYYERTLPALLALMDAKRDAIRVDILRDLELNAETYTLGEALTDLERYWQAGSLPGALSEITTTAGKTKGEADRKLKIVRDKDFAGAVAQERVDKLLDAVLRLPQQAALELLTSPPTPIDEQTLNYVRSRLGNRPLSEVLNSGSLEDSDAKDVLRMIIVLMSDRSEENLVAWNAAIIALMGDR